MVREPLNDRQSRLLRDLAEATDEETYTYFIAVQPFGGWRLTVMSFRPGVEARDLSEWDAQFEEHDLKLLRAEGFIRLEKKGRGQSWYYEGRITSTGRRTAAELAPSEVHPPVIPAASAATATLRKAAPTPRSGIHLTIGSRLQNRYVIGEELGRGGMGCVYRADDLQLKVQVAIKVLALTSGGDNRRERFRREVTIARRIAHANVCRVYDYHEDQGLAFCSMEYVEGESLREVLKREGGPIAPHRATRIVEQIAAGLDAMHDLTIVHRDLKPANVMLLKNDDDTKVTTDRIKLIDLGLAKDPEDVNLTTTGVILGTVAYMSPEQARGQPATPSSDVYSLAVVAYELLVGGRPFIGDDRAVLFQHVHEPPPGEPLAERVRGVVLKSLAKDPNARHVTATEFARALRLAMDGQGEVTSTAPDTAPPEPNWPGITLQEGDTVRYFDWGPRVIQARDAPSFAMTAEFQRLLEERFHVRAEAGLRDISLAYGEAMKDYDWIYETDQHLTWRRKLRASFGDQYLHATRFRGIPRKCSRCGKRYGDSAINCPDCGIPLPINSQVPAEQSFAQLQRLATRVGDQGALDAAAVRVCGLLADRVRARIEALVQSGQLAVGCGASILNRDGVVFALAPGFRAPLRGSSAMTYEATYELRSQVSLRVTVAGYAQVEIPRGYDGTNPNTSLVIRWMLHVPEQTPAQVLTEVGIAAVLSSEPTNQALVASGIDTISGSLVDQVVRALTLRVIEKAHREGIDLDGL